MAGAAGAGTSSSSYTFSFGAAGNKKEREREKNRGKRGRKHTSKFHVVPMMITLRIAFDRFALFNALSKANNKGSTHGVK